MKLCNINFLLTYTHKAGDTVLPQSHTCCELVYYITGSGFTTLGDTQYKIAPNTFTLIRPQTVHNEQYTADGDLIFIGFEMDDIPEEFLDRRYHDSEDLVIYKIITDMVAEFKNHKIGYDRIMSLRLHELIVQLERLKAIEKDTRVDITEIAMRYIEQYYSDTIDWNRLAVSCNYSYSQFRHVFTKKVGISLNQYLMNCRLNAAKKLLTGTTLSCTEISYRCGFSNSSKFSTYFRKAVGLSPKDFRLQAKKALPSDTADETDITE